MLFSVGTRVKFLHSRDKGVVTALLENGMVNVLLDGENMEIPAFIDDLVRAESAGERLPSVKAKIVPGKQAKMVQPPRRPAIESQYAILKSLGIQLAFDPVLRADATAERFKIFLINDTPADVIFTFCFYLNGKALQKYNGKLDSLSVCEVGEMWYDHLNDSPAFHIECWRLTTEGTGTRLQKEIKIKPKQFFKRMLTAPLLNRKVHLYRVFEDVQASRRKDKKEDLRSYTKRNTRHSGQWSDISERMHSEVLEYAEFVPEVDLHAERLSRNPKKLSSAEILRLQLHHFDAFLQKALRVGAERVFIIHGVGKGRLRGEIAKRLQQNEAVKRFKNEWHPRYGYGATEVEFR